MHLWAVIWLHCLQCLQIKHKGRKVCSRLSELQRKGPWRMENLWLFPEIRNAHIPQKPSKSLPHTSFCGMRLRTAASHSPRALLCSSPLLVGGLKGSQQGTQEKSLYRLNMVQKQQVSIRCVDRALSRVGTAPSLGAPPSPTRRDLSHGPRK